MKHQNQQSLMMTCHFDGLKSKPIGTCEATTYSTHEVWLPIKAHPNYEVSNMGRVKSLLHGKERILKPTYYPSMGYRVTLNGRDRLVARLVATTFYGYPIHTKLTVNHIDGNRHNNDINNLELISREENNQHAHRHGLFKNKYNMTVLKDTHTGDRYIFDSHARASEFLGKGKSFVANAKRDGRLNYGRYQIVV